MKCTTTALAAAVLSLGLPLAGVATMTAQADTTPSFTNTSSFTNTNRSAPAAKRVSRPNPSASFVNRPRPATPTAKKTIPSAAKGTPTATTATPTAKKAIPSAAKGTPTATSAGKPAQGNTTDPRRAGQSNGQVADEFLCTVPFDPEGHKVACFMLEDLKKLNEAYKAHFGEDIDINSDADTAYRTLAQQQALYEAYQNGTGNPAAAPGGSIHGWGLALDLVGTSYGSDKYAWLDANAGQFGFDDDIEDESWHWGYQK